MLRRVKTGLNTHSHSFALHGGFIRRYVGSVLDLSCSSPPPLFVIEASAPPAPTSLGIKLRMSASSEKKGGVHMFVYL